MTDRYSPSTSPTAVHLHHLDHPATLRLLDRLVGHRRDRIDLGFEPMSQGAWVDWERLASGPLSSTEVATVHIARGCATIERAGGLPATLAAAASWTVTEATGAEDALAALLAPCPPPDVAAGFDRCPCGHPGSWPCPATRAAWLARGLDPDAEAGRALAGVAAGVPAPLAAGVGGDHAGTQCESAPGDHRPVTAPPARGPRR